jgi:hypothetical protein
MGPPTWSPSRPATGPCTGCTPWPGWRRPSEAGTPQLPPGPTGEQLDAWLELAELLGRRDGPDFRRWLVSSSDAHTDPRAMRHWELVGILQGRPDEEFTARVADHAWLLAALRHHRDHPA